MRTLPTGYELRAARTLIGWQARELAKAADVDAATISRLEGAGKKPVHGLATTVDKVVRALQKAGVTIEPGVVRLTKAPR
jgi:predicted transcriptional regulator